MSDQRMAHRLEALEERILLQGTLGAELAAAIDPIQDDAAVDELVQPIADYPVSFDGAYTSLWRPEQAALAELDESNTIPLLSTDIEENLYPGYAVGDHWPVRNPDGSLAQINGFYVVVGLMRPIDPETGVASPETELRYVISENGSDWQPGGLLLTAEDEGMPGDNVWSGSSMYDAQTNRLYQFWTTIYDETVPSPSVAQVRQEMVLSIFEPEAAGEGLAFNLVENPGVILQPENQFYTTPEVAQTGDEIYGFRDPAYFMDPRTGQSYLTFTANLANQPGRNDGVIGLAVATNDELTEWQLLPPLVAALGTAEQMELPHLVYNDGAYHLFTSVRSRVFLDALDEVPPSGLYGFTAPNLWGPYIPYNESGLVLGNPEVAPEQTYAFSTVGDSGPGIFRAWGFTGDLLSEAETGMGGRPETAAPIITFVTEGERTALARVQMPMLATGSATPAAGAAQPPPAGADEGTPAGNTTAA